MNGRENGYYNLDIRNIISHDTFIKVKCKANPQRDNNSIDGSTLFN